VSDRRHRGVRGVIVIALAFVVATGCAGVPDSGPVHVGEAVPADGGLSQTDIRVLPPPPEPGMSPRALVSAFLRATVDPDDDYAVARAYLANGTTWSTSGITTYDQGATTLSRLGADTVSMHTQQVGMIDSRGDYVAQPRELTHRFTVVRQGGQWRISRLPAGVLLATVDAERSLQVATVYYLNRSETALVPEQLLVDPEQPGLATTLVRALLSGPVSPLTLAARTAAPAGTQLLGNVPIDTDGVADVDLSGPQTQTSPDTLAKFAAQLVWTLHQITEVTAVQLSIEGVPLAAPGFPRLLTTARWESYNPSTAPVVPGALYIHDRRVDAIGEPVPPALATLTGVQAPAVSADGTTVAALRSVPGGVQLLAGPYSGPTRVRLSATRITPPSFDPSGDVVVAADSPTGRRIVELTTDGKTVRVHAPASVLAGPVSDLLISPDGTRVAMVLGVPGAGRLVVGLLAVDHGQPSIVGVHQVLPSTSDVQGLAWNGPGVIVTTTRSGASGRTVLASDTDGYSPHDLSVTRVPGPPVQVADAPGQRVLAVADDVLYRLVGTEWQRLSTGSDPSYAG
jgi:hypothetical protein